MALATIWNPKTGQKQSWTVGVPMPSKDWSLWTGGTATGLQAQQAIARAAATTRNVSSTQQPAATNPTVVRSGADFLAQTANTGQGNLDQWKSGANLVEAARSIIQMKQGYNKDIQTAKQVWGEKARDTSAWGQDKQIFSGMSPADQASIRAKQYAVAETHLAGLADEEKYRAASTKDTLQYISDIYKEKVQELKDQKAQATDEARTKIQQEQLNLERLKANADLGVQNSAKDLYGSEISADGNRIGFKEGGSVSWRSNNPGNIKYGEFAKSRGAIQGAKATDGGYFAVFPDVETGKQAMKDLLLSPAYQKLTVDQAMKRWSNNGYGAEVFNKDYATMPLSTVTSQQLDKFVDAMIKREGWKEGKDLTPAASSTIKLSDAAKASLAQSAGLTNADVRGFSEDQWLSLKSTLTTAAIEHVAQPEVKSSLITKYTTPEALYNGIQVEYPFLDTAGLNLLMNKLGYTSEGSAMIGLKWLPIAK